MSEYSDNCDACDCSYVERLLVCGYLCERCNPAPIPPRLIMRDYPDNCDDCKYYDYSECLLGYPHIGEGCIMHSTSSDQRPPCGYCRNYTSKHDYCNRLQCSRSFYDNPCAHFRPLTFIIGDTEITIIPDSY